MHLVAEFVSGTLKSRPEIVVHMSDSRRHQSADKQKLSQMKIPDSD